LERQAEGIDHYQDVGPFQSCFETLLEEQALTEEARLLLPQKMRGIREKFRFCTPDFNAASKSSNLYQECNQGFAMGGA